MDKKALIHVENTSHLTEFAKFLVNSKWTIYSANQTEDFLKQAEIPVFKEQALQQNNFYINDTANIVSKILNTRIPGKLETLQRSNLPEESYFIVCLNINPETSLSQANYLQGKMLPPDFKITTLIRNAFINYENVLILTDPKDYKEAMIQLRTDNIETEFRTYLAAKALNLISAHDSALTHSLMSLCGHEGEFLNYLSYPLSKEITFTSGANSHQKACLYIQPNEAGIFSHLNERRENLSYTMINDVSFAWEQICLLNKHLKNQLSVNSTNCEGYNFTSHFTPLTGIVFTIVVKFNSIVGASLSSNSCESFKNAYKYEDSITDLVLGCSSVIDEAAAEEIVKGNFCAIIAPDFTESAKQILGTKPSIHLIPAAKTTEQNVSLKPVLNGILFQTKDTTLFTQWNVKTQNRPSQYITDEMAFGTLLTMKARSHCAILLKNNAITGIGQGFVSSQKAVSHALSEAKSTLNRNQNSGTLADLLVCDTKLTLTDEIKELIENGLSAIIQTGGCSGDDDFTKYCNDHGIVMIFTNMTHISF